MLRASGTDFDVVTFVTNSELDPVAVFKKGEPRSPVSNPDGPKHKCSGLNFLISNADFSEFELQTTETLAFVRKYKELITKLQTFPGVENITVDFGVKTQSPGWCSFNFVSDLLLELGKLGISPELSVYPAAIKGKDEACSE